MVWAAPASAAAQGEAEAAASSGSAKRLLTLRTPRERQFVGDRARVWVRSEFRRGATVKAVLVNGVKRRGLTRRLRASERALAGGRKLLRVRVGRLRRGRNLIAVVALRGGRWDSETVMVDRARRLRGLIRRFRVNIRLPRHPHVTLRPSRLRVDIAARLNGRDVSDAFEHGAPLVRRLRLSPKDGLRPGLNRLAVKALSFDGRFQSARRTFFVSRGRPLADAGPDRRARAGLAVRLNGSRSLPAAGRSLNGVGYRWTVIAKPAGAAPVLTGANRRRAILRTDPAHPGRYVTRLRVSSHRGGGVRTTDTVDTIAEPQPRVPVETIATAADGTRGIALGMTIDCEDATVGAAEPCFYANPGDDDQLQVLVLDRQTLVPPAGYSNYNRAYSTSSLSAFATQMQAFATDQDDATCPTYDTDKLVLLVLRSGSIADTENFAAGLDAFNVSPDAPDAHSSSDCVSSRTDPSAGPLSMLSVPGTLSGKAWVNDRLTLDAATGDDGITGSLTGYLKEVADDPSAETLKITRGFTYPDALFYDTRGEGASSALSDDVFVVGSDSVPLLPGTGATDGISVISFDALNPTGTLTREAFVTNVDGDPLVGLDFGQLNTVLGQLMAGKPPSGACTVCGVGLVFNGQTGRYESQPENTALQGVLAKLEQLGLNPDTFARALNSTDGNTPSGYGTYSMISADGVGYASSNVIADGTGDTGQNLEVYDGDLTGDLRRGPDGILSPLKGDPAGLQGESVLIPILYGEQGDWLLTPALADTTSCSSDTTGPETGCTATGQEVAFAYIVEQAFGKLFPDQAPELWSGAGTAAAGTAAAAQAAPDSSGRSADSLDGDGCDTETGGAPDSADTGQGTLVVDAAAVRSVSLVLRSTYPSLTTTLDEAEVLSLKPPSGTVPFTADDFSCAQNQMIDELAAREQVLELMELAGNIETNSATELSVDFSDFADNVQNAELSSLTNEINAQSKADSAYWLSLTTHLAPKISPIVALFSDFDPVIGSAVVWLSFYGDAGAMVLDLINGRPGNPLLLTREYVMLEAQLEQEELSVETQIADALTAQANGVERSEMVLLSGPVMMAAFNDAAGTTWNFGAETADVYTGAQNAYLYNVRQLVYQALWPQVYSAVRFSYEDACQTDTANQAACWNPSASSWQKAGSTTDVSSDDVDSLALASQPYCRGSVGGTPFGTAGTGTAAGSGQGTEYQPQVSVASTAVSQQYMDYVMVETDTVTSDSLASKFPSVPTLDEVEPFFEQPGENFDQSGDDPNAPNADAAPGFYAPDFWYQNLPLAGRMSCNGTSGGKGPTLDLASIDGWYQDLDESQDAWPTPPYKPDEPCTWAPIGSTSTVRATCAFHGSAKYTDGKSVNLSNLVASLGGDPATSGIWIAAYGGKGSSAGSGGGAYDGGKGGGQGYAQTYFDSLDAFTAANRESTSVYYWVGSAGTKGGSIKAGGAGAASTVVGTADLTASATPPCVLHDDDGVNPAGSTVAITNRTNGATSPCATQTVLLIAGASGAGGTAGDFHVGGVGGGGATAIAGTRTVSAPGGNGGDGGRGGYEGVGGNQGDNDGIGGRTSTYRGRDAGTNGIGGSGGSADDSNRTGYAAAGYVGWNSFGIGGNANGQDRSGGGGGGGFGGGGGGGSSGSTTYGGGGGGGGGSYALKGDKPPSSGAIVSTPPRTAGDLIIVVDGVDGPSPAGGGLTATMLSSSHQARGGSRLRVRFATSSAARVRLVVTGRGGRVAVVYRVRRAGKHRRAIRLVAGERALRRGNYRLRLIVTDALGRRATDTARLRINERGR